MVKKQNAKAVMMDLESMEVLRCLSSFTGKKQALIVKSMLVKLGFTDDDGTANVFNEWNFETINRFRSYVKLKKGENI